MDIRSKARHNNYVPLLIGYPISEQEIHWQALFIPINNFPGYGQKISGTNTWIGKLKEQPIIWAQTRNSSYRNFYGRGAFHHRISTAKVLIIGIGAIGSMVATTLVRGGVIDVVLIDHDVKEPENICRSEYGFLPGITSKVQELTNRLTAISPFVSVKSSEDLIDLFKVVVNGSETGWINAVKSHLDKYDIIFDCSTDNDIAFLLGMLDLKAEVFSFSITNNARELICGVKLNLYSWLQYIFHQLGQEMEDLYAPAGCWNPTFRASYNDIAVLVQFALCHINSCFKAEKPIRHFYLSCADADGFEIKLREF